MSDHAMAFDAPARWPMPARPGRARVEWRGIDAWSIRTVDIVVSLVAMLVFLPLLATVALAVAMTSRGPVIFVHRRLGRAGRSFACLKFRTMVFDADNRLRHLLRTDPRAAAEWARDHKLRIDPRITPLGRLLRGCSVDELPQLLNVLRGEMSLVGPRPIVQAEAIRYGRFYRHYCECRPGMTGLWQVSGRNDVSYRRRVAMDVEYARRRSFGFNARILARTVPMVIAPRGSY